MIDEVEARYIAYRNQRNPPKKGFYRQWVKCEHSVYYYDYEPFIGNQLLITKCGCDVRFMPRINQ